MWWLLDAAVHDRRAALHQLAIATAGPAGPDARVMVLRGVDRNFGTLRFHSDRRASKIAVLTGSPAVAIVGYDIEARTQLRLMGTATVASDGAGVDTAWAATGNFGRRAYQTILAPGTVVAMSTSGISDSVPATEGRSNFAVLTVVLGSIEWLHLAHDGHRRARHRRTADGWAGDWLVP